MVKTLSTATSSSTPSPLGVRRRCWLLLCPALAPLALPPDGIEDLMMPSFRSAKNADNWGNIGPFFFVFFDDDDEDGVELDGAGRATLTFCRPLLTPVTGSRLDEDGHRPQENSAR
jgi:hypothetical protein